MGMGSMFVIELACKSTFHQNNELAQRGRCWDLRKRPSPNIQHGTHLWMKKNISKGRVFIRPKSDHSLPLSTQNLLMLLLLLMLTSKRGFSPAKNGNLARVQAGTTYRASS